MITALCSSVSETWDKYSLAKDFSWCIHAEKPIIISLLKLRDQGCKIKEKILSKLNFFFIILLWQTRNNLYEIRSSIEPTRTKSNLTLNNQGMRFNWGSLVPRHWRSQNPKFWETQEWRYVIQKNKDNFLIEQSSNHC